MEQQHKRRIHYSGKYPRRFEEKCKELNPEKYGEEIAHVIAKGNTPAGMHIPIMVDEILEVLAIKPGERGFDATLGYGGHTCAMLEKLAGKGHLISGDIDPIESKKTEARIRAKGFGEELWELRNMNFCQIDELVRETGPFDFILADLGVSSMQIDNPERGFTYKSEGPLDLRLNPEAGITAAERLSDIDEYELIGMLQENADEPYAEEIARYLVKSRRRRPIRTTKDLHEAIGQALAKVKLPKEMAERAGYSTKKQALARAELIKKSSARVFQALRRLCPARLEGRDKGDLISLITSDVELLLFSDISFGLGPDLCFSGLTASSGIAQDLPSRSAPGILPSKAY